MEVQDVFFIMCIINTGFCQVPTQISWVKTLCQPIPPLLHKQHFPFILMAEEVYQIFLGYS